MAMIPALAATASVMTGTLNNPPQLWSSDGNPGWNGTGVPDAQGALAEFITVGTVTNDLPYAVTVGTISFHAVKPNGDRAIAAGSGGIILDFDGEGPGMAIVSNNTPSRLIFNTQTASTSGVMAYDDLLLVNTGSSSSTYSISLTARLRAFKNVYIDNISSDTLIAPINLGAPANSIDGNIHILRGSATSTTSTFGNAGTIVYLGSTGNGAASWMVTGSSGTIPNPIIAAFDAGGKLILGASYTGNGVMAFTGALTLNGDLSVTSSHLAPGCTRFTGQIHGTGTLIKIGAGAVKIEAANIYSGGTVIEEGTLIALNASALGSGTLEIKNGAALQLDTAVMTVDSLRINGKPQPAGTYGSSNSDAQYTDDVYFAGTGTLEVLNGVPLQTLMIIK